MIKMALVLAATAVAGLCAITGALQAQSQARDPVQAIAPPSGSGRITGTVVDGRGDPVRRATVTISGDMRLDRRTVTDNEGRFVFDALPSGRFTVSAEKSGSPRMSFGAKRPYRSGGGVFLDEGEHASDVAITLAPGAVLTGVVHDERGQPLPGVPVMAWLIRTSLSGERTLDFAASSPDTVVTDDRGRYRTYGLPPGDYTIGTSWYYHGQGFDVHLPTDAEFRAAFPAPGQAPAPARPGAPAPVEPPRFNYAPVFAPGVTDPLSASTYTLAAGDVREGVDLQMRFEPTSRIEGIIVNPNGPVPAIRLAIARRSSVQALNSTQVSSAGPNGRFTSTSLSPGQYTVLVESRASAGTPAMWAMAEVFLSGGTPSPVTLTLAPALTVAGQIAFDSGPLPPPADLSRVSVTLSGVGPLRAETRTTINAAGVVSISGVMPGRYVLRGAVPAAAMTAGAPAGATWSVRSVMFADRDVTDRPFEVNSSDAARLVVTFTDRVSELGGVLTRQDGSPETDHFVIAVPADRDLWIPSSRRIVSTRPDRTGRYQFRGLPAGDYLVAVTTDLVPTDLQDVGTLHSLAEQAVPIRVTSGERQTLDLRTTGGQ